MGSYQRLVGRLMAIVMLIIGVGYFIFHRHQEAGDHHGAMAKKPIVGILQVAVHPALDLNCQGIIDGLKARGLGEDQIDIQVEQAQANPALANQIAQKFIGQRAKVIVALGTIPAQAALQARHGAKADNETYIIFSSVTDPIGARLVDEKTKSSHRVTGISNYVSAKKQLTAFKKLRPDLKSLGVIYNSGEPNSVMALIDTKKAAQDLNIEIIEVAAIKTNEVQQAAQRIVGDVQAIFINNDNTALAAFEGIVRIARHHNVAVFSSDLECVDKGATAAFGPDQYLMGDQTANLVAQSLRGELKDEVPFCYPTQALLKTEKKDPPIKN